MELCSPFESLSYTLKLETVSIETTRMISIEVSSHVNESEFRIVPMAIPGLQAKIW